MAEGRIKDTELSAIAAAIRSKNGSSTVYKPSEMAAAIGNIPTGITPTGTVNITQNGTTDVTQYASAAVNVPNSYGSGDEGKVVSNGALVAQGSDTVTENGTVDTTMISSLTVNVSGGGQGGNLFNYYAFKNTPVYNGTAVWGDSGVFTLTATGSDCYTNYGTSYFPRGAIIPVKEGQSVTMTWDATSETEGALESTDLIFFANDGGSPIRWVNAATKTMTLDTVPAGTNYLTFRFGSYLSGSSITYSNVFITRSNP